METELVFALPAGSEEISGGNLYNAQLIAALARRHRVRVTDIAACRADVEQGKAGCYFIDSLDLQELVRFPAPRPGQAFGLLVHHLPSLEPDIAPDDPALALERAALLRCDVWLVTSPFTAALLRGRGHDANRIVTVIPAAPPCASTLPSPAPPFVFAMVGNLIPRKGMLPLLEALTTQLTAADQFQLELAGRTDLAPEYSADCLALAHSEPLRTRVRYLGPVPYAAIGECYQRAAAFVSASKMETFGMALQEASAFGLPILALDGGYTRQHFTPEVSGVLVHSIPELAQQLLALVRQPARMQTLFDSAQRSRVSNAYTWDAAAEQFRQQLSSALAAAQRGGRNA
jgi:glycosyltransferase involved in cell wall biosynthesis